MVLDPTASCVPDSKAELRTQRPRRPLPPRALTELLFTPIQHILSYLPKARGMYDQRIDEGSMQKSPIGIYRASCLNTPSEAQRLNSSLEA